MIQTTIDEASFQKVRDELQRFGSNAAFAASVGLNRTADEIQTKIREHVASTYTLRRKTFVLNTIYRKPGEDWASKDKLTAGVRVNPERDVLAKFEQGGLKTAQGGGYVAVPIGARPSKTSVVPERYRLATLFFGQAGTLSQIAAVATARRKSTSKRLIKRSVANDVFVKDGIVFQKVGKRIKALWVFKKATPLPANLRFIDTAVAVANERLIPNILGAIDKEINQGGLSTGKKAGG